ncbi:MAG TPA: PAS domain S-box protein [Thermodesulfovibrionales bacterium]|nr:PAS domain S-box protein [Thermodesulfovibrionales bacterium]
MLTGLGLRTKALIWIIGQVIFLGAAVVFIVMPAVEQRLFMKLQKRGISLANNIAANSLNSILTERYFDLELQLRDMKGSEDDIVYIFALGSRGRLFAHTFENGFPSELRSANEVAPGQSYSVRRIATEKGEIIDFAVPLSKGEMGSVHLGISSAHIKEDVNSILGIIIWLFIAVLTLAAVMGTFLSQRLTRRILELTKATKSAGRGDLQQEVAVRSADELGQLETTFNNMIRLRREAEKALRRSEEELSSITSNIAEGIYVLNEQGRIVFMNPEAEHLLGWTMAEVNERTSHDLFHCKKADGAPLPLEECSMHKTIRTGERFSSRDEFFVRKDGTVFPVSVVAAPIIEGGKAKGSVVAFQDITEFKSVQDERETLISELQDALSNIRTLSGLLPICAWCKKIRDDKGYWNKVEVYIQNHSGASFTHGICPECLKEVSPQTYQNLLEDNELPDKM